MVQDYDFHVMPDMYAGNGNAQDESKAMSEPNALEKLFAKLKVLPCLGYHRGTDQLDSDMLHIVTGLHERAECCRHIACISYFVVCIPEVR